GRLPHAQLAQLPRCTELQQARLQLGSLRRSLRRADRGRAIARGRGTASRARNRSDARPRSSNVSHRVCPEALAWRIELWRPETKSCEKCRFGRRAEGSGHLACAHWDRSSARACQEPFGCVDPRSRYSPLIRVEGLWRPWFADLNFLLFNPDPNN